MNHRPYRTFDHNQSSRSKWVCCRRIHFGMLWILAQWYYNPMRPMGPNWPGLALVGFGRHRHVAAMDFVPWSYWRYSCFCLVVESIIFKTLSFYIIIRAIDIKLNLVELEAHCLGYKVKPLWDSQGGLNTSHMGALNLEVSLTSHTKHTRLGLIRWRQHQLQCDDSIDKPLLPALFRSEMNPMAPAIS